MKKLVLGFTFLIAVFCAFAFNAQADTIPIYGYISFSGTLDTNGSTSLMDATIIDIFSDVSVSTHGGTFDYVGIPGDSPVTLSTPFVFAPSSVLLDFWVIDVGLIQYSYDVLSAHIDTQNANQLNLQGTGFASITGFEDTDSIWFLSATSAGPNRATFTLSTLVPSDYNPPSAVPEPATLMLLGMGLLGLAGLGRKKK